MTTPPADRAHHSDTSRLEAFSDGVFAIAITVLVLEIGVPHVAAGQSLAEALRHLWPSYFGFAVSFLTVGVMWINHHAMFKDIDRQDHTLVVLNRTLSAGGSVPSPQRLLRRRYWRAGTTATRLPVRSPASRRSRQPPRRRRRRPPSNSVCSS